MMETDRWNVLKIISLHLQKTDEQIFFNLFTCRIKAERRRNARGNLICRGLLDRKKNMASI